MGEREGEMNEEREEEFEREERQGKGERVWGGGGENLIDRCGDCSGHTRAMREGE